MNIDTLGPCVNGVDHGTGDSAHTPQGQCRDCPKPLARDHVLYRERFLALSNAREDAELFMGRLVGTVKNLNTKIRASGQYRYQTEIDILQAQVAETVEMLRAVEEKYTALEALGELPSYLKDRS